MSIQSARRQAEALVASMDIKSPPVDVEEVAGRLQLTVLEMELEDDVSGVLITNPEDEVCIVINEAHALTRQRFSIAHEIAHHYLEHQFEEGEHVHVDRGYRISHRDQKSSTGTDLKEIEANQFAASLLMPVSLLKKSIKKLRVNELHDGHVTKLSEEFQVSEQAMTIRLSVLGLLS